ncbi:hypothetical protein LWC33_32940 [Pseudonocardia sp. RS11V-5]|uniref:hypothetical protein n=1 Tax=Pseudonocardia terrae TaxID=2905831 RepID=UPI001E57C6CF|nr:hypothetical protein [Pseudonocardia terrae]MCE3556236.1 hypothetical protein [Pseudonocardia terrae]
MRLASCYRFGARRVRHAERHTDRRLRLQIAERVLDLRGGAEAGRLPGALATIATSDTQRVAGLGFGLPLLLAQGTRSWSPPSRCCGSRSRSGC